MACLTCELQIFLKINNPASDLRDLAASAISFVSLNCKFLVF